MPSQAILPASLFGTGQSRPSNVPAAHGTEFQKGMLDQGRRGLAAGELLALPAIDATVVCMEGELWLTRDGDPEDYILGAGSSMHVWRNDQAAVQALKPSRLRLIPT